jgi:polyhydroxybutyrate depolymerase
VRALRVLSIALFVTPNLGCSSATSGPDASGVWDGANFAPDAASQGTDGATSSVDGGTDASVAAHDGGSDAGSALADGGTDAGAVGDAGPIGGSRPVVVHVPNTLPPGTPMPLVLMLHGYSASGATEEAYLNFTALSDSRGFIYAYGDGTVDSLGQRFWNATNACCDLFNNGVDDSSYLSGVISEIEARYPVDPKRVYLFGHSNGGFMSYRMACDHADQIAAIASLAGAMWEDVTKCNPSQPVAILEIHGTSDLVIPYNGGSIGANAFPSAPTTVSDWVTFDGCSSTPDTSLPPLDLDSSLAGNETSITAYATGCRSGGHAELWTINGGSHIPVLSSTFGTDVIDFLYAHARP